MITIERDLESVNPQSVNRFYHGIINLMCQLEYEKNTQTFRYIFLIDTTRDSHIYSSLHICISSGGCNGVSFESRANLFTHVQTVFH